MIEFSMQPIRIKSAAIIHLARLAAFCGLATVFAGAEAALAQSREAASVPRFATTRSQPINVRVGPGTRYDVSWVFKKPGLPVEIIQEFDVWDKIRYFDGEEGWVHQSLLSAKRAALVRPWQTDGQTVMHANADENAPARAYLSAGFLVDVESCEAGWCAVEAAGKTADGKAVKYDGFILQFDLWGVYPDEEFD